MYHVTVAALSWGCRCHQHRSASWRMPSNDCSFLPHHCFPILVVTVTDPCEESEVQDARPFCVRIAKLDLHTQDLADVQSWLCFLKVYLNSSEPSLGEIVGWLCFYFWLTFRPSPCFFLYLSLRGLCLGSSHATLSSPQGTHPIPHLLRRQSPKGALQTCSMSVATNYLTFLRLGAPVKELTSQLQNSSRSWGAFDIFTPSVTVCYLTLVLCFWICIWSVPPGMPDTYLPRLQLKLI